MEIKLEPLLDTLKLVDIDDSVYFGAKYSNYVSNSKMKLINPDEGGSYDKYKAGFGPAYSQSLLLGTCVHYAMLSPEEADIIESSRPSAKLGFVIDEIYKLRRQNIPIWKCIIIASNKVEYYKGKLTTGIVRKIIREGTSYYIQRLFNTSTKPCYYLNDTLMSKYKNCVKSLNSNRQIVDLLHPSYIAEPPLKGYEQTILLDVKATIDGKETILKLKAKLDNFTYNYETGELVLNDLKTSGKPAMYFGQSMIKFNYNRQIAMYGWLLQLVAKHLLHLDYTRFSANFLVVSTADYSTRVYKVNMDEVNEGWKQMVKLLKMIAVYQINEYDLSRCEYNL